MADFNVLMLGARRTGKTSVLASMISCFEEAGKGIHNLSLKVEDEAQNELNKKIQELEAIFLRNKKTEIMLDSEPSSDVNTFDFKISLSGKKSEYSIRFTDFPGEYLNSSISRVRQLISESPIILIAVDTPHLMEEQGIYHNVFNKVRFLEECLEDALGFESKQVPRLVLFVPLKCEKYYHENRMNEVVNAVKNGYSHLFAFFNSENIREFFTIAILPILTLGDVVFSKFGKDEYGNVSKFGKDVGTIEAFRPKCVYFKFINENACFSPRFCEQPMLYILTFIVVLARLKHDKKSKWSVFLNILLFLFSPAIMLGIFFGKFLNRVWKDKKFQEAVDRLKDNIKYFGDGYTIVQDPLNIFIKQ